jgi:hypothetical protein
MEIMSFVMSEQRVSFPVPSCCILFVLSVYFFQRKEEKEIAMYGRVLSSENADGDGLENEGINNDGEEMETTDASLSGGHLI